MFHRRNKTALSGRIREFFWPRSGWNRSTKYVFHRVARLRGSPHSIAAGFACGAAMSFTPFVGLHFVLSAILAWFIRANIIASAIGTAVGNPWTFPFIWVWVYNLGQWMGASIPVGAAPEPDFVGIFGAILKASLSLDFTFLFDTAWPVFWPMFVGGVPTAVLVWLAFYMPMKPLIAGYQNRRILRRRPGKAAAKENIE